MAVPSSTFLSRLNGDVMKKTVFTGVFLSVFLILIGIVSASESTLSEPRLSESTFSEPILAEVTFAEPTSPEAKPSEDPADISPWETSYQLEAAGKYAEAEEVIRPLRTKSLHQELAVQRTAWLKYLQGDYNDAIDEYRIAMRLNPVSIDARLGLSLPLMAQKRWREATHHLKVVILALAPWNYTAHIRLLKVEEAQQLWETMGRHAYNLSKHYPSDVTALVYLARAYAWQARKKEAKEAYIQVLARFPHHLEANQYLGNN